MTALEKLSELDRLKVEGDSTAALMEIFQAMHEHMGWCGDIEPGYWRAAFPVLVEAMAAMYRPEHKATPADQGTP